MFSILFRNQIHIYIYIYIKCHGLSNFKCHFSFVGLKNDIIFKIIINQNLMKNAMCIKSFIKR
jgi:hypothetical protein